MVDSPATSPSLDTNPMLVTECTTRSERATQSHSEPKADPHITCSITSAAVRKTIAVMFRIQTLGPAALGRAVLASGSLGSGDAFFPQMRREKRNDLLHRQGDRLFPIVKVVVGPILQFDKLPVLLGHRAAVDVQSVPIGLEGADLLADDNDHRLSHPRLAYRIKAAAGSRRPIRPQTSTV
ncbi:hypothetical protein [Pseudooceanicola nanhaiensis]|uniref:hypothetical protein n=1 Tax=Pseudooceanicola nanhaiensis TaxID=375761 RepID=UPI001CD60A3D|nr:hypothetical protein [Pseudooceanicola nanhaiensis]MCA0922963.1 hypothetical protein [Pseudooceanicola nanhaiensis]